MKRMRLRLRLFLVTLSILLLGGGAAAQNQTNYFFLIGQGSERSVGLNAALRTLLTERTDLTLVIVGERLAGHLGDLLDVPPNRARWLHANNSQDPQSVLEAVSGLLLSGGRSVAFMPADPEHAKAAAYLAEQYSLRGASPVAASQVGFRDIPMNSGQPLMVRFSLMLAAAVQRGQATLLAGYLPLPVVERQDSRAGELRLLPAHNRFDERTRNLAILPHLQHQVEALGVRDGIVYCEVVVDHLGILHTIALQLQLPGALPMAVEKTSGISPYLLHAKALLGDATQIDVVALEPRPTWLPERTSDVLHLHPIAGGLGFGVDLLPSAPPLHAELTQMFGTELAPHNTPQMWAIAEPIVETFQQAMAALLTDATGEEFYVDGRFAGLSTARTQMLAAARVLTEILLLAKHQGLTQHILTSMGIDTPELRYLFYHLMFYGNYEIRLWSQRDFQSTAMQRLWHTLSLSSYVDMGHNPQLRYEVYDAVSAIRNFSLYYRIAAAGSAPVVDRSTAFAALETSRVALAKLLVDPQHLVPTEVSKALQPLTAGVKLPAASTTEIVHSINTQDPRYQTMQQLGLMVAGSFATQLALLGAEDTTNGSALLKDASMTDAALLAQLLLTLSDSAGRIELLHAAGLDSSPARLHFLTLIVAENAEVTMFFTRSEITRLAALLEVESRDATATNLDAAWCALASSENTVGANGAEGIASLKEHATLLRSRTHEILNRAASFQLPTVLRGILSRPPRSRLGR